MSDENSTPIDVSFLKEVIGDDKDFERELFEIFIDNAAKNIANMKKAMDDGDSNAWYMASHAFKGASSSIGAFKLSKTMEMAQTSANENNDRKSEIIAEVKEEYAKVEAFINGILGQ